MTPAGSWALLVVLGIGVWAAAALAVELMGRVAAVWDDWADDGEQGDGA